MVETNEDITVKLYNNCMDIIDKDEFITTIDRGVITNAKIETENHKSTLRIRTSIRDNLLLKGNVRDLGRILDYCISKYREVNTVGYYSMLISCCITYISWIAMVVIGFLKGFDIILPFNIYRYVIIIALVNLFTTYCLLELFSDSKPEVKYPEK